jgi:predicted ABC-type ATPase
MWYKHLAPVLQIPLINADRMMLAILPDGRTLPQWARSLRDEDLSWQRVAQQGVQAFVAQAMLNRVPFAMETVFSQWQERADAPPASKIDLIRDMQVAGYFVLLLFVGLSTPELSVARVTTRVASGGHTVPEDKLYARFPRTQHAIGEALSVVDAAVLVDNSREEKHAFTVCRVQLANEKIYDWRDDGDGPPASILNWLDRVVAPGPKA